MYARRYKMNKTTLSNPVRSIAFFLTAIILACTFGFTVDGWQMTDNGQNDNDQPPSEEIPNIGTGDETTDDPNEEQAPDEPEIYIPEYTSRLTGLEINEEMANAITLAFVMSSDLPAYGISSAEVICEFPTETGETRLMAFIPECENLWKIGSITSSRGYISNLAKYLGSALVSNGCDDDMDYTKCDISNAHLDLSKNDGFHYTEYAKNVYTNRDMLISGLKSAGISSDKIDRSPLPFNHVEFGLEKIHFGDAIANEIRIGQDYTEMRYNEETKQYSLFKEGNERLDALNGETLGFENCFVLFADSVTYDNSDFNQMVMDTIGEGRGFYFTEGSYTEIFWTASSGGIMTFYSLQGEKLTVNRGSSYISFVKSSLMDKIEIQ